MNLREKFAAAKAAGPRWLADDLVQMNYALMTFTQAIPQMVQTAIDRVTAGEVLEPQRDASFMQVTDIILGSWRHYGDMREKLEKFAGLPAMQELKDYLSHPDVDIAFTAYVTGKSAGIGDYYETLHLAVNPDLPFALSTIAYDGMSKTATVGMTENDKLAWTGGAKPKMTKPALNSRLNL